MKEAAAFKHQNE